MKRVQSAPREGCETRKVTRLPAPRERRVQWKEGASRTSTCPRTSRRRGGRRANGRPSQAGAGPGGIGPGRTETVGRVVWSGPGEDQSPAVDAGPPCLTSSVGHFPHAAGSSLSRGGEAWGARPGTARGRSLQSPALPPETPVARPSRRAGWRRRPGIAAAHLPPGCFCSCWFLCCGPRPGSGPYPTKPSATGTRNRQRLPSSCSRSPRPCRAPSRLGSR